MSTIAKACDSHTLIESPEEASLGLLWVGYKQQKLLCILWDSDFKGENQPKQASKNSALVNVTRNFFSAYFSGNTQKIQKTFGQLHSSLYLVGTPFQKSVWNELQNIAYGTTVSYKQFATSRWTANHTRPVASAVAKNPLSILLPCHRVIGSNGKMHGFAGGLEAKKNLLHLEQSYSN